MLPKILLISLKLLQMDYFAKNKYNRAPADEIRYILKKRRSLKYEPLGL